MNKKKHIVIVEDDEAIREVMTLILTQEGYDCTVFTETSNFLQTLQKHPPQLLFIDISLTGENGAEMVKKIKDDAALREIKIVIVSANSEIASIAKNVGADAYLQKPFDLTMLTSFAEKYTA